MLTESCGSLIHDLRAFLLLEVLESPLLSEGTTATGSVLILGERSYRKELSKKTAGWWDFNIYYQKKRVCAVPGEQILGSVSCSKVLQHMDHRGRGHSGSQVPMKSVTGTSQVLGEVPNADGDC